MALISDVRIRAKIKFSSVQREDTFEIHIIDDEYDNTTDGDPLELKADRDGFSLKWGGNNDELSAIVGSQISFGFMVTNTDTETLAKDILDLQEERFGVRLYKNEDLEWFGMIYQDDMKVDLTHKPYVVRVTAFDGLGGLQKIHKGFPSSATTVPGAAVLWPVGNFASIIVAMLKDLDKLELGDSNRFLMSAVNLHSDNHVTYSTSFDTLAETGMFATPLFFKDYSIGNMSYEQWNASLPGTNYNLFGANGNYYRPYLFNGRSWKDVMERMLKPFFSQIKMEGGLYSVVPYQKYRITGSQVVRVFGRNYYVSDTSDPTTASNVDVENKTFMAAFGSSTSKLRNLTMNFKPAVETVVCTQQFDDGVMQPDVELPDNTTTANFTTADDGFFGIKINPGIYRFENENATDQEVWAELRAVITCVHASQTWYLGPPRDSSSSHLGQPLQYAWSWSTDPRYITVSQTNYFDTQKTGTDPYPFHWGPRGHIDANTLEIITCHPAGVPPGRNRYIMEWLHNGTGTDNVIMGQHVSGSNGSITVKVEHVALNKSDNQVATNFDTTSSITDAERSAANVGNTHQGTVVQWWSTHRSDTLIHSVSTGQTGSTVSIKDVGSIYVSDKRTPSPMNELNVWNGTDWTTDAPTKWAEGGDTPTYPLVQWLLQRYATVYQKPVKLPDMAYIGELVYYGFAVPSSAPFPIGGTGTTYYFPVRSTYTSKDDSWAQTWIALDSTDVEGDLTTLNDPQPALYSPGSSNMESDLTWEGLQPYDSNHDDGSFPLANVDVTT